MSNASPVKAGIIGAAGYAGAELIRLLSAHKHIKGLFLSDKALEGQRLENSYLNFFGRLSLPIVKSEEVIASSDLVFGALQHGIGEPYAKACVEKGIPFIDLSADFRFDKDEETFKAWYGKPFDHPELREHSVYGMPELNRQKIKSFSTDGAVIIANPGCFPTGASLGIFPALVKDLACGTIIVNSATGITGGGREPQRAFHFPECSDSMSPYKAGAHRHMPEISRNLKELASRYGTTAPPIVFTPHLSPMNRGILSTIYIPLKAPQKDEDKIREIYTEFYIDEPFVRVLPPGAYASTGRVRRSNFCDISVHLDYSGSTLIVATAIDNMIKGASGQAVQNMNILFGFDETTGLEALPALF